MLAFGIREKDGRHEEDQARGYGRAVQAMPCKPVQYKCYEEIDSVRGDGMEQNETN